MDHMFIMRLAALLFGGGIASCLFPGKSRMSHVLFLLLVLAETAVAHATIPDGWWFLLPGVDVYKRQPIRSTYTNVINGIGVVGGCRMFQTEWIDNL